MEGICAHLYTHNGVFADVCCIDYPTSHDAFVAKKNIFKYIDLSKVYVSTLSHEMASPVTLNKTLPLPGLLTTTAEASFSSLISGNFLR